MICDGDGVVTGAWGCYFVVTRMFTIMHGIKEKMLIDSDD